MLKLNSKNPNNVVRKWTKATDRHFTGEVTGVENKLVETCSKPATREMQINTTMS
jgi:hypothetical protein